jgi:N-acyl-D-amino-acid deacylase
MKSWLKIAAVSSLVVAFSTVSSAKTSAIENADYIVSGGTIYTGTASPFVGDVAVKGDRILYVGPKAPYQAARTIDARGLIVAPGFIDPHTHIDEALLSNDPAARLVLPFLTQGVTTAFIGVDGSGPVNIGALLGTAKADGASDSEAAFGQSTRDYGVNFAAYVGLGSLRRDVVGQADRAPSAEELSRMSDLVSKAMCDGAMGFSTGLFYAPQSFAQAEEVFTLARAAAAKGGIYDSHIRDESSYTIGLKGAVEEALAVGRAANIHVHIAHIKALGVDVHGHAPEIVRQIEAAQKAGLKVTADQYPWAASGTGLSAALLPRWAQDGGRTAMLARFDDAATMAKMRPEIADNMRRRGGPQSLLITSGPKDAEGKTLAEIAKERGVDPIDAAIAILRQRETGVASFNQSEGDIAHFMRQPWVVTSSDASGGHPRYYASFARKYDHYVKDQQVLNLQQFIAQSTSVTAKIFGLEGRGELKAGAFADVIAFDPARFAPRADFQQPTLFSTGMKYVLVNGALAIDGGEATGKAGGKPLPRSATSSCTKE